MYIPRTDRMEDDSAMVEYIRRYPFGTLFSTLDDQPYVTHLPFLIVESDEGYTLLSHMAKANGHVDVLDKGVTLTVFQGAHGYVSPKHYERENSVPTWDYIAVHVHGELEVIHDDVEACKVIEKTISFFDRDYLKQYEKLDRDYLNGLMKELVAFRMKVTRLEGKQKMSRDRSQSEKMKIEKAFSCSKKTHEQAMASYMHSERKDEP